MKYYLLLWVAVIIGQVFVSTVVVWLEQRKNPNINYLQALREYYKKEVGTYIMVLATTIVITFVLSDWMDLKVTKEILASKEKLTRFEQWQMKFRTYATGFGMFIQLIAPLFYKGGLKAVSDFGKTKGAEMDKT